MPKGRVHLALELGTLPLWVAGGAALAVERSDLTLFSLSYVTASLFLSPDLDLWRATPTNRWGPARVIWAPYALLFRHRGLSHSPLLGPLTRLAYLGAFIALGWLAAGGSLPRLPTKVILPILVGVYLPNLLHVAADRVHRWVGKLRHHRL